MNRPNTHDAGVLHALVTRLLHQRLPRALTIKQRVDSGKPLRDFEIDYLDHIMRDFYQLLTHSKRFPQYHPLVTKIAHLYQSIATKALENEG